MSSRGNPINTVVILVFILFLLLVPAFLKSNYWLHVLSIVGINVILAASVHTIWCTGELSLGTAGFMAMGGYGSALLAMRAGISVWAAMPLGGLLCAIVAVALGYPFMRAKGIYFSILTLLTGEIFRLTAWYYRSLTGGPVGLSHIPSPEPINIPGIAPITFDSKITYYYLIVVAALLSLFVLFRLQRSQVGFTWRIIRERDNLAASVGINVLWYKISAFAIGCFFAGIAGALFAHFMHLLAADASGKFGMFTSIYILIYMVVGGEKKFAGPIIGAVSLTLLPEVFRPMQEYRPIIFGALVIFMIFFMPQGIVDIPHSVLSWGRKMVGR